MGCPVAASLVGAGVGHIGLVDADHISVHNLHRQHLYHTAHIGQGKVAVAKKQLLAMNPNCSIEGYPVELNKQNIFEIAEDYDIIIDGTDQIATRYLIDHYCVLRKKVYIHGSVYQFEGQVARFDYAHDGIAYSNIFPKAPKELPTCESNGILPFLPNIIGQMQAMTCIKHLCKIGSAEFGITHYDAIQNTMFTIKAEELASYPFPKSVDALQQIDYQKL